MAETFLRNPEILSSKLDQGFVALSVESGLCYSMPGPTASIWQLIEHPQSLSSLVTALRDEYDVDEDTCVRDVTDILEEMLSRHLIVRTAVA